MIAIQKVPFIRKTIGFTELSTLLYVERVFVIVSSDICIEIVK